MKRYLGRICAILLCAAMILSCSACESGSGKRCYGFKTDTRSIELGLDLNPMISGCMIKVFKNNDGEQLIKEIKEYLPENEL